jgi:hypothetical protein
VAGPSRPDTRNWPSVFFAFKHNDVLLQLTRIMRDDLWRRQIYAYRLFDYPMPGTNLRERAERSIAATNGMVLFWSQQGAESEWVRREYDYAKNIARKPVCLILFSGVARPSDWHPDIEWVNLEGASFPGANIHRPTILPLVPTRQPDFDRMMNKIAIFAQGAHDLRIGPP